MNLKLLGVGTAFSKVNFVSNALIEELGFRYTLDFGNKISGSFHQNNIPLQSIKGIFITHLHADHVGGIEELALFTHLNGLPKPYLFSSENLIKKLWENSLSGDLECLRSITKLGNPPELTDFFEPVSLRPEQWEKIPNHKNFYVKFVPSKHILNMESYGILFKGESGKVIFFSGDTKFNLDYISKYGSEADIILHDCQLGDNPPENELGVHATFNQLLTMPDALRKKTWIYHYDSGVSLPSSCSKFAGVAKTNSQFEI